MGRCETRIVRHGAGGSVVLRVVEPFEAGLLLAYLRMIDRTSEHRLMEPGERSTTVQEQEEWLGKKIAEPRGVAIGAYLGADDGALVGFLNFRGNEHRRTAHHGTFGIAVHPEHRGLGIGTALIRRMLEWATEHPEIEKVSLSVFEPNTGARVLYERLGFREEGRREKEFKLGPGKYVDGIEMSTWVKPA